MSELLGELQREICSEVGPEALCRPWSTDIPGMKTVATDSVVFLAFEEDLGADRIASEGRFAADWLRVYVENTKGATYRVQSSDLRALAGEFVPVCTVCGGSGEIVCPDCNGEGCTNEDCEHYCHVCRGEGYVKCYCLKDERFRVALRFEGEPVTFRAHNLRRILHFLPGDFLNITVSRDIVLFRGEGVVGGMVPGRVWEGGSGREMEIKSEWRVQ